MFVLVNEFAEIAGSTDSEAIALPGGWAMHPAPAETVNLNRLYFDGSTVQMKPAQPSAAHYWDKSSHTWRLRPTPPAIANWTGLLQSLRNSEVFGKIYTASTQNLRANSAYTLLFSTITTTHSLPDFEWAIAELRLGLVDSIGDFSVVEINWINGILEQHNFDVRLS